MPLDFSSLMPAYQPVELPSRGKLYAQNLTDHGFIEIREYTAREESLINQMNRENSQRVINNIINSCLKGPIQAEDLTSEDVFYVLMWLRANSYGPGYEIELTCPYCGYGPSSYTIDLSQLKITYIEDGIKEPMEVTLPRSGLKVYINALRRAAEMQAQRRSADVKQKYRIPGDPNDLLKRAYSIVKVVDPKGNEEEDPLRIEELCCNYMLSADTLYLDQQLNTFTHGVDPTITVPCYGCQRDITTGIPPSPEFFRPTRTVALESGRPTDGDPDIEQVREPRRDVPVEPESRDAQEAPSEITRAVRGRESSKATAAG